MTWLSEEGFAPFFAQFSAFDHPSAHAYRQRYMIAALKRGII